MTTHDLPVPPATPEDAVPEARGRRFGRLNSTTFIGALGLVIVIGLVLVAIFAPALAPYDPTERVGRPFATPSPEHPLGTNDIGQDLLSELIYGTRV